MRKIIALIICVLLFQGCQTVSVESKTTSKEKLILEYISKAVHAEKGSKEHIKVLWELFKLGEEIAGPPLDIWNRGPAYNEKESQLNGFEAYRIPRISRISEAFYVYYGLVS